MQPEISVHARSPRAAFGPAILAGACAALAGCSEPPSSPAPPSWPAGTVLVFDGEPLSAEDVDRVADVIARIEPQDSLAHVRRIALTNVVFPKLAGRRAAGPARDAALACATTFRAALAAGSAPPAPVAGASYQSIEGDFETIGLEAWSYGIEAAPGAWSEVIETVGAFQVVRLDERRPAERPRDAILKLGMWVFPYVDRENPRAAVESALDHSKLEFVDESWRDVVPQSWQYRLRGGTL